MGACRFRGGTGRSPERGVGDSGRGHAACSRCWLLCGGSRSRMGGLSTPGRVVVCRQLVDRPVVGLAARWIRNAGSTAAALGAGGLGGVLVGEAVYGLTELRFSSPSDYWHVQLILGLGLAVGLTLWRSQPQLPRTARRAHAVVGGRHSGRTGHAGRLPGPLTRPDRSDRPQNSPGLAATRSPHESGGCKSQDGGRS